MSIQHTVLLSSSWRPAVTQAATLPPLLLIHGMLASRKTYRSLVRNPRFAPERAVISIDLRNHGESPNSPNMMYQTQAADVLHLMDLQKIESAVICGHSMGGKVAMTLALTEPRRVSGLVAVDIAPRSYRRQSSEAADAVQAMASIDPSTLQSRADGHTALREKGITDEGLREFLLTNLAGAKPPYVWRANAAAIMDSMVHLLSFPSTTPAKTFNAAPVLFIRGELSNYITPSSEDSAGPEAEELFPGHRLVTIPQAGHWLQNERPDAFCSVIRSFLAVS